MAYTKGSKVWRWINVKIIKVLPEIEFFSQEPLIEVFQKEEFSLSTTSSYLQLNIYSTRF